MKIKCKPISEEIKTYSKYHTRLNQIYSQSISRYAENIRDSIGMQELDSITTGHACYVQVI